MRCPHCNEKTANHDLWCVKCGKQTELVSKDLSAIRSLKLSWNNYKAFRGSNLPVGISAALTGALPLIFFIWLLNYALQQLPKLQLMVISNLVWLFFIPIMLVPFSAVCKKDNYEIDTNEFFSSFKYYFRYGVFSLISVLFYLIILFLCKGDPILNVVWLVLVIYWIAIVLPVPILMERYELNAFKAIKIAYKQLGDLRWNIFLLIIALVVVNILAVLLFFVGLAVTIPFSWFAIRDYVDKLIDFEVIEIGELI
jgi:hypothetical protein